MCYPREGYKSILYTCYLGEGIPPARLPSPLAAFCPYPRPSKSGFFCNINRPAPPIFARSCIILSFGFRFTYDLCTG